LFWYCFSGSKRVPHGGVEIGVAMMPTDVSGDPKNWLLPVTHTCSKQIDIPAYPREDVFLEKLKIAVNADPAFGEV